MNAMIFPIYILIISVYNLSTNKFFFFFFLFFLLCFNLQQILIKKIYYVFNNIYTVRIFIFQQKKKMSIPFIIYFVFYLIKHLYCYQIIYVDSFESGYDSKLKTKSCQWKYLCTKQMNFCEYGCCLSEHLKSGFNFLNTHSVHDSCYVNLECDQYDLYFDIKDVKPIIHFSELFFLLNSEETLYIQLKARKKSADERTGTNRQRKHRLAIEDAEEEKLKNLGKVKNKKKFFLKNIRYYKYLIKKKFRNILLKLLISFILIYIIICGLFFYNYSYIKKIKINKKQK